MNNLVLIKENILRCRSGDWEHCQRVVKWIKVLDKGREDLELLVIAGYIHDIGWRDVLKGKEKLTWDEMLKNEPQANSNSEPYARELLTTLGYSLEEVQKILQYIKAADAHKSENDNEAVIVDSDFLSKLDNNHLREKYEKSEWQKVTSSFEEEYPTRIKTAMGREIYPKLLNDLKEEIGKE